MKFEMLDKLFYMLDKAGIKDFFDLDLFKHLHPFNNASDLFFALAKEINKRCKMKFTNKDLAKAMGLKIGDRIDIKDLDDKHHICNLKADYELCDNNGDFIDLKYIINHDIEILPRKQKVGEQFCGAVYCNKCPLVRCCIETEHCTLYENLEGWNKEYNDKEIYDILKSRLDKEVEE